MHIATKTYLKEFDVCVAKWEEVLLVCIMIVVSIRIVALMNFVSTDAQREGEEIVRCILSNSRTVHVASAIFAPTD